MGDLPPDPAWSQRGGHRRPTTPTRRNTLSLFDPHRAEADAAGELERRARLLDRLPYPVRGRGHVNVADAIFRERVDDGIHHRRQRSGAPRLAAALGKASST
jgi:hypothetical protein